jgi:acetylglutamate kinase
MQEYIEKANVLMEALPYIKEFNGITVVIKYGGSALINDEIKDSIIKDIALMKYVGFKPVVIHGGGPDINAALARVGIESRFRNGLRITDEPTMEIVEMVLAGKINKAIAAELSLQGVKAVGISGKDANMIKVKRLMPDGVDIGLVGEAESVDAGLLRTLIDGGFVPVIASIGTDGNGQTYNINADYAAVSVAAALKAEKLVYLTDVEGVRTVAGDSGSVASRLGVDEIRAMIRDGSISGGMIPKVECCIAGVEAGVRHVHILDGRVKHSLILEIFTTKGIGTLVER